MEVGVLHVLLPLASVTTARGGHNLRVSFRSQDASAVAGDGNSDPPLPKRRKVSRHGTTHSKSKRSTQTTQLELVVMNNCTSSSSSSSTVTAEQAAELPASESTLKLLHALWKDARITLTADLHCAPLLKTEGDVMAIDVDADGEDDYAQQPMVWVGQKPPPTSDRMHLLTLHVFLTERAFKMSRLEASQGPQYLSPLLLNLLSSMYPAVDIPTPEDVVDHLMKRCLPASVVGVSNVKPETRGLVSELMPFQRRAVAWMLAREGVNLDENHVEERGEHELDARTEKQLPPFCRFVGPRDNIIINGLTGAVGLDADAVAYDGVDDVKGGILAEEMGLGKTIEILALILSHQASLENSNHAELDDDSDDGSDEDEDLSVKSSRLINSGATLVISPAPIVNQWMSEIEKHAPSLKVLVYGGHKKRPVTPSKLARQDIVLTTYDVLRHEVYLAHGDSERSRRAERVYERPTSPLVLINWWRVCLDEAQMVESTVAKAAGTPLPSGRLSDLEGLTRFLNVHPLTSKQFFKRLTTIPQNFNYIAPVMSRIMHRTSKAAVETELNIPNQVIRTVNVDFSAVEAHFYDNLFLQCVEDVRNFGSEGRVALMRRWLLQLRQTCCHPQIGERNKRVLGAAVRSMEEVLDVMRTQCDRDLGNAERQMIGLSIERAQMWEFLLDYAAAIKIYQGLLPDVKARVERHAALLEAARAAGKVQDNDFESEDGNESEKDANHMAYLAWRAILHRILFFLGCVYHEIKDEVSEEKYYTDAANLRKEIMASFMANVRRHEERTVVTNNLESRIKFDLKHGFNWLGFRGVVCGPQFRGIKKGVEALGAQWDRVLSRWRLRIIEILRMGVEEDEEAEKAREIRRKERKEKEQLELERLDKERLEKGEDAVLELPAKDPAKDTDDAYHSGLDLQNELDALLDVYTDAINDRREILKGEKTSNRRPLASAPSDLHRELQEERLNYLPTSNGPQRRTEEHAQADGLTVLLRSLRSLIENTNMPSVELNMANTVIRKLADFCDAQSECLADLNAEIVLFRRLANARIAYFRHLQRISDDVTEAERPDDVKAKISSIQLEESQLQVKIAQLIGRSRYLEHLADEDNVADPDQSRTCNICKEPFLVGFVTSCGHLYCEFCTKKWIIKHCKCALCNKKQSVDDLLRVTFTLQPSSLKRADVPLVKESFLPPQPLVPLKASRGTKLDTLVHHILSLPATTKSLVFSQWTAVLSLISDALAENNISHARMSDIGALRRFRTDPDCRVCLMRAGREGCGVTLVEATQVFLVEPVVDVGVEMQAIGRVHRIGQDKDTCVWRYLVRNSIEERVLEARDRMMGDVKGTRVVKDQQKIGSGGEDVPDDEVGWCLFGDGGVDAILRVELAPAAITANVEDAVESIEVPQSPVSEVAEVDQDEDVQGGPVISIADLRRTVALLGGVIADRDNDPHDEIEEDTEETSDFPIGLHEPRRGDGMANGRRRGNGGMIGGLRIR